MTERVTSYRYSAWWRTILFGVPLVLLLLLVFSVRPGNTPMRDDDISSQEYKHRLAHEQLIQRTSALLYVVPLILAIPYLYVLLRLFDVFVVSSGSVGHRSFLRGKRRLVWNEVVELRAMWGEIELVPISRKRIIRIDLIRGLRNWGGFLDLLIAESRRVEANVTVRLRRKRFLFLPPAWVAVTSLAAALILFIIGFKLAVILLGGLMAASFAFLSMALSLVLGGSEKRWESKHATYLTLFVLSVILPVFVIVEASLVGGIRDVVVTVISYLLGYGAYLLFVHILFSGSYQLRGSAKRVSRTRRA